VFTIFLLQLKLLLGQDWDGLLPTHVVLSACLAHVIHRRACCPCCCCRLRVLPHGARACGSPTLCSWPLQLPIPPPQLRDLLLLRGQLLLQLLHLLLLCCQLPLEVA
jgi:hypothetical protein